MWHLCLALKLTGTASSSSLTLLVTFSTTQSLSSFIKDFYYVFTRWHCHFCYSTWIDYLSLSTTHISHWKLCLLFLLISIQSVLTLLLFKNLIFFALLNHYTVQYYLLLFLHMRKTISRQSFLYTSQFHSQNDLFSFSHLISALSLFK